MIKKTLIGLMAMATFASSGTMTFAATSEPGSTLQLPSKKNPSQTPVVTTCTGNQFSYSCSLSATATGYSSSPSENGGYGGTDYFGNPLKVGTIAVDPSVIPLGSKVYVTGYSFLGLPKGGMICRATDIGGAIKKKRIDIFIPGSPKHVDQFGLQNVKVYVLK